MLCICRVFPYRFVASKARKVSSEKRGGAEDRLPKMSAKFAPGCGERAAWKPKLPNSGRFGTLFEVDLHHAVARERFGSQNCQKLAVSERLRLFFLFCVFLWLFCVFCFPPLKIYNCRVQLLVCFFDLTVMLPNDKTFYITLLRAFPK